jgi:hypothetical protein
MTEKMIEDCINEVLCGVNKENALKFVAYLRASNMVFEKGKDYWEDKLYWCIKYKDSYVCYILIGNEEKPGPGPWIVWSDNSGSDCYNDFPLDEHMKETAWKNIDFCTNCGYCGGGTDKTIFGKKFNNVCLTTMRFTDPDIKALELMKKIVEIRKNDIGLVR